MAWSLCFLGYPDQALAKAQEAVAFARALADPPTLTLTFASLLYRLRPSRNRRRRLLRKYCRLPAARS
ncbi:MAG: hypothetical protein M0R77_16605 [Gammaproteobacteria bacterium]|nr:hypothetical protein [Gammaproteobacteria bacterium]